MRFGCLFGIGLMVLAFGIMGFFMLPLLFEGNESVMAIQAAVLCGPGETFTTDFYTMSDLRGTARGGQVYCVAEDGTRTEATGKSMLYAMIGFIVPFMLGLFLAMRGASKQSQGSLDDLLAASGQGGFTSGSVQVDRRTYEIDPKSVDVKALLQQFGIDAGDGVQVQRGGGSLTEQLKDLQAAYDKQLITREEYDRLRQQILDRSSGSS